MLRIAESGAYHTDLCKECNHVKPLQGIRCTDCQARRADMRRLINLIDENHPMRGRI